jgi:hypothetical protein
MELIVASFLVVFFALFGHLTIVTGQFLLRRRWATRMLPEHPLTPPPAAEMAPRVCSTRGPHPIPA